jgi:hypothetical protein
MWHCGEEDERRTELCWGKTEEAGRLVDLGGRKSEDNIEMGFREIWWRGVDCINLAEDRTKWRALVNTVSALGLHKVREFLQ